MRSNPPIAAKVRKLRKRARRALITTAFRSGLKAPKHIFVPPGRVAMFHSGRCGSTVLADLLDQHSRFFWDGEILKIPRWKRPGNIRRFLELSLFLTPTKFYGFETKFSHVGFHGFSLSNYVAMLDEVGFNKFVVVRRKNFLRQVLSSKIGRATKIMRLPVSATAKLTSVHLDVDDLRYHRESNSLLGHFDKLNKDYRDLEIILKPKQALWLNYEDHIAGNPLTAYEMVCDFLAVETDPVSVRLIKVNPFPVRKMIENYNEVERKLSGTPYEWMLHD